MARVLISVLDELLGRVDRKVSRRQTNRSAFLQEAARRELGWPDPEAIDAALARGRRSLADAGSFESTELIRAARDSRHAGG